MSDYKMLANALYNILGMKNEAVGMKLLRDNHSVPGYENENKYTFCQFIMKAREGNKLLATADNVVCPNGASALGFQPVPERIQNGDLLFHLGSFQKEGAIKTMELMPRFRLGEYSGIALASLSEVDFDPDIIVLETIPEQLMWLSLASIHKDGGRHQFSTSISNGTCVDITVVPHLTQKLNVSLGCYGCRNATNIPDENLIAGFPGDQLESILDSLELISKKIMLRTREKKAYERLK
jgi:uncharacterized protein (DUF169 family)